MLSSETGIDKEDKVTIANRLMMSTATIAYDEFGFPYSPRKQGAGLADINKAMTTQAYIYVPGSDKTKIETFDSRTGEFTLSFNVKNLSSSQRKYKITTKTMTETIASDKLTVAERAYMLDELCEITIDGDGVSAGMLTLAGNADAQVTVTIKLGNEAKKYIDDNFTDPGLSLNSIGKELQYNPKYISGLFKEKMGIGINEYINTARCQQACTLIDQGLSCVKEISALSGYNDALYFSKVFKKRIGVSPKQYITLKANGKVIDKDSI